CPTVRVARPLGAGGRRPANYGTHERSYELPPPHSRPPRSRADAARLPDLSAYCIGLLHRNGQGLLRVNYSQSPVCDQGSTSGLLYPSKADTPLSMLDMCKECQFLTHALQHGRYLSIRSPHRRGRAVSVEW